VAKQGQKKPNFIRPFFKNKKRPKELKKGQKLQIWPQKGQTGNHRTHIVFKTAGQPLNSSIQA